MSFANDFFLTADNVSMLPSLASNCVVHVSDSNGVLDAIEQLIGADASFGTSVLVALFELAKTDGRIELLRAARGRFDWHCQMLVLRAIIEAPTATWASDPEIAAPPSVFIVDPDLDIEFQSFRSHMHPTPERIDCQLSSDYLWLRWVSVNNRKTFRDVVEWHRVSWRFMRKMAQATGGGFFEKLQDNQARCLDMMRVLLSCQASVWGGRFTQSQVERTIKTILATVDFTGALKDIMSEKSFLAVAVLLRMKGVIKACVNRYPELDPTIRKWTQGVA